MPRYDDAEREYLLAKMRDRIEQAANRITSLPTLITCPKCGRLLDPTYLEMTKWTEGQSRICAACFKEALDELMKESDDDANNNE